MSTVDVQNATSSIDEDDRTPIELIKCKMQVQALSPSSQSSSFERTKAPGPLRLFSQTLAETGFRGLWLGHTGTFIRETGGTGVWFGTKEAVAGWLIRRRRKTGMDRLASNDDLKPKQWESAASGACAGAAFNLAFFPADTVKSAMQTRDQLRATPSLSSSIAIPKNLSFAGTLTQIVRTRGVSGLYAGCGITICRSVPSSAMIFWIWDGLWRWWP